MSQVINTIPTLQVRHKSLIAYNEYINTKSKKTKGDTLKVTKLKENRTKAYQKNLSKGAIKRLSRAIDILVQCAVKKRIFNEVTQRYMTHTLSFITLTIPTNNIISIQEGYNKGLSRFLNIMRKRKLIQTYIWKVEVQQRGQLHYHITTTSFINYQVIKNVWNNILRANRWSDEYYNTKGHYDCNSTDVHKVNDINNLSGYLIKEFCKSIQNNYESEGKKWDCSNNLNGLKYFKTEEDSTNFNLLKDGIDDKLIKYTKGDKFELYSVEKGSVRQYLSNCQISQYNEWRSNIQKDIK